MLMAMHDGMTDGSTAPADPTGEADTESHDCQRSAVRAARGRVPRAAWGLARQSGDPQVGDLHHSFSIVESKFKVTRP
jgi:hypothetical protein